MTTAFYAPPTAIQGDRLTLPADEANHAVRVLRVRAGDEIVVVDGEGGWYRVRLEVAERQQAAGRIVERRAEVGEAAYDLTLAVGLLKNAGRFETFLEKAVELGVRAIVPLVTERTERPRLKRARAEGILLAATKQSGRSRRPPLAEPTRLVEVLGDLSDFDLALVAHEAAGAEAALLRTLATPPPPRRAVVLVGPEGGFTEDEVARAQAAGARIVSLGPRRLRTETAAITAAAAFQLHAGRFGPRPAPR